jgi:hypothetical protein
MWLAFLLITRFTPAHTQTDEPKVNIAKNVNVKIHAEPLEPEVNTLYNELGPMPTKDGKRLYFSREGFPGNMGGVDDEDIWYSDFDETTQSWTDAKNMGAPLNNAGGNFITGVGRNSDTLLLANVYRKNGKMIAGVSISVFNGNQWSFPVPVNIEADYNIARRATYDVSHDRKVMIISQQKFDTRGNLDLYVAFRQADRKQPYLGTESINLGTVINTAADELSPWLAYDGITLYFASDGHNGYGRMDLFKSIRLDDTWTNWSEPENLGPGINTILDEISFNFNPLSRYAYFARGMSSQNSNIYRIEMTHFFKPKDSVLSTDSHPFRKPAEIGETRSIANMFDSDQLEINKEVILNLEIILGFLQKYKTVNMLVSAHSKKHDTRKESMTLSTERARRVVDYLTENGIEKGRLTYQGFGHDIVANLKTTDSPGAKEILSSTVEFKVIGYAD